MLINWGRTDPPRVDQAEEGNLESLFAGGAIGYSILFLRTCPSLETFPRL
jgi:hypothetical protein